jgi:hypothetical protein
MPKKKQETLSVDWIRDLSRPYLKGYRPTQATGRVLCGYRFSRPAGGSGRSRVGFFAGFLVGDEGYGYLDPQLPECLLFAFVDPPSGSMHERLVRRPNSMLRSTHEYIAWLTHHPPRFQFSEKGRAALVRHLPLNRWPEGRRMHYARNFLIEGLAWLVRSGLVRNMASVSI